MNTMHVKDFILFFTATVIGAITFYFSTIYFVGNAILLFYVNAVVVFALWNMLRLLFRADLRQSQGN